MSSSDAPSRYQLIALRRHMNFARCSGESASASTRAQAPLSTPRIPLYNRLADRDPSRDDPAIRGSGKRSSNINISCRRRVIFGTSAIPGCLETSTNPIASLFLV
jgi:hypothetical protein